MKKLMLKIALLILLPTATFCTHSEPATKETPLKSDKSASQLISIIEV